jgi:hypothetical protein
MTLTEANRMMARANAHTHIAWHNRCAFNGDYEDIYELTEQPRTGTVTFFGNGQIMGEYSFAQMDQKAYIRYESKLIGIGFIAAMRIIVQEIAER